MNTQQIFAFSDSVRYVATYVNGRLALHERPGLCGGSSPESDSFEELVVNPTLITLLGQRGNLDCGGLQYVLVRYGNFYQFVQPVPGGHVSVAIDTDVNPVELVPGIRALLP